MTSQKKRREREKSRAYYWTKKAQNLQVKEQAVVKPTEISVKAQRTFNYKLRKVIGNGLVAKLKGFVKNLAKKKKKELADVGISYYSPSKHVQKNDTNVKPGKKKQSQRKKQVGLQGNFCSWAYENLKKKRSKHALAAKSLLKDEVINDHMYKKKLSWKSEFAEKYFEQKSQHLPCKKTIDRHNRQKKILNKSIVNLYQDFIQEHGTLISRATFFRKRPQNVLSFTKTPFRQCLCEVCLNPMLKMKMLNRMLPERERVHSLKDVVQMTVCDKGSLECISRECADCGVWKLDGLKNGLDLKTNVEWTKWESVPGVKGNRIDLCKKGGSVEKMIDELKSECIKLPLHDFTQSWQMNQFSSVCRSVPNDWAIMILDFSENYLCEKQDQPQSSYFGYSQVTVHPCVLYYKCSCDERITDNITVVTDELNHSSHLVDVIMRKLLNHLEGKLPSLKKVVIFSDGCSSQYKSKIPFAYLSNLKKPYTVERCYFGARHGKNPCDALGGILKQAATRAVKSRQAVIQNAKDLHQFAEGQLSIEEEGECTHLNRKFWLFSGKSDLGINGDSLKSIYGTRQFHSLLFSTNGLQVRNFSCFCQHCIAGSFSLCENGRYVNEWMSMKEWEKMCKLKVKLQKDIAATARVESVDEVVTDLHLNDDLNTAFLDVDVVNVSSREEFFRCVLDSLSGCKSFKELESVVFSLLPQLNNFPVQEFLLPTAFDCKNNSVDKSALDLVPKGLEHLFPVCVDVDGNCMPRSFSLALFCSEEHHIEIRCRISIESVLKKHAYLNLPKEDLEMLCTLSECQGNNVLEVYEKEVMSVCKLGVYMGLWQMMAAATALNVTIMSVYPKKGQSCSQFLNRTLVPLDTNSKCSIVILWTSTRDDMVDEYWIANHVEPLLPLTVPTEIVIEN